MRRGAKVARMEARIERPGDGTAWVIGDDDEVIVIDLGSRRVLEAVGDREILAVICTHGTPPCRRASRCRRTRRRWRCTGGPAAGGRPDDAAEIEMADGGRFEVADVALEVMHTAGHTPGSVSLYCADLGRVHRDALRRRARRTRGIPTFPGS